MGKSNNKVLYNPHASSGIFLAGPVKKQALRP